MKHKFKKVIKQTNNKYLNLYLLEYQNENEETYFYNSASRREKEELAVFGTDKTDAVRMLPYFKKDNKYYVVLIKEFRHILNDYVYSTPAGLVDSGEGYKQAAIRELKEEIGAEIKKITETDCGFSSIGLSDEFLRLYDVEIESIGKADLQDGEDITTQIVELFRVEEFLKDKKVCLSSMLQIKNFLYKVKLNEV